MGKRHRGHLGSRRGFEVREAIKKIYRHLPIIRELARLDESLGQSNVLLGTTLALLDRLSTAQTVRLLDFDLYDHPRYGDRQRLLRYHAQVCSQNGEDGIIHEIFRRIEVATKDFVEVGVGNGVENNTAFLLSQGWTGFWIDGSDDFLSALEGRTDLSREVLGHLVSFVTAENVITLFERLAIPQEFDLLSLDIDQNTYHVWAKLSEYRPRVAVVEYNAAIPADTVWKAAYDPERTWDGTQNFGASLKALELLGRDLGYSLVGCDPLGVNAFFVRDDLVGDKFLRPFTAENHHEPPRYSLVSRRSHPSAILDRQIFDGEATGEE